MKGGTPIALDATCRLPTPPPPPTPAGHTPDAGVPALAVFAAICVPGWAIKQWVNVVQLRAAAAQLVTLDLRRDAAATLAAGGGSGANGAAPPPPPGKAKQ